MLSTLVAVLVTLLCIRLISELFLILIRKPFVWINDRGKCWAVVTGAGSGLGFEWARQLALKGYHLMLLGLEEDELEQAKTKILEEVKCPTKYDIQIRTLQADFNKDGVFDEVENFLDLEHKDVFVLVNNAGTSCGLPLPYLSGSNFAARNRTLQNVNLISTHRMIDLVLPSMVRRKRGLVCNMSSGLAFLPSPLFSSYAATKSYILKLTECLAEEFYHQNITFKAICPLMVSTNMTFNPSTNFFNISPRDYITVVMNSIKYHEFEASQFYIGHKVQNAIFRLIALLGTPVALERFHHWFIERMYLIAQYNKRNPQRRLTSWEQLKYMLLTNVE